MSKETFMIIFNIRGEKALKKVEEFMTNTYAFRYVDKVKITGLHDESTKEIVGASFKLDIDPDLMVSLIADEIDKNDKLNGTYSVFQQLTLNHMWVQVM